MSGPMKCTHCGALLPPPSGPVFACGYCHAQFQAPALPSGYVWLTNESVWALMKERLTGVESTFLHPSIPPKKLTNVRRTHAAHLPAEEAVIGIYDGTAFGSATDGFAVTVRGLYFKNQMEHPQLLEWQHVREEEVWSEGTAIKVGRASLDTLFGKDDEGLY